MPQLSGIRLFASLPFVNSSSQFLAQFYGGGGGIGSIGLAGVMATKVYLAGSVREERELHQLGLGGRVTSFFSIGVASKKYVRRLGNSHTEGFGVDLGVLIEPDKTVALGLTLADIGGVSLQGANGTSLPFQAEMTLQIGGRIRLLADHLRFGLGMDISQQGDVEGFHFGLETVVYEAFAARFGWNNGEITWGLGLGIKNLFDVEAMLVGNSWTISTELTLFGR